MRRIVVPVLLLVPVVAFGGFRVSSFKKETRLGVNHWNAASAIDSDLETCWMIDPERENPGEWIEIDLPAGTVDKVAIANGWQKNDVTYSDYARIKGMRVQLYDLGEDSDLGKLVLEHTLSFEDTKGWQTVELPDTKFGNEIFGGRIRLTVTEVYDGQDYPSLGLSELLIHLTEEDVFTTLTGEPTSSVAGHGPDLLHDDNPRTYWASEAEGNGQSFSVEASGFGVSAIGIHPGPKPYARPKTVEVIAVDTTRTHVLEDSAEMQWLPLPPLTGYTGSSWGEVQVKVIDTYPGTKPGVAIGEVKLRATTYEGL